MKLKTLLENTTSFVHLEKQSLKVIQYSIEKKLTEQEFIMITNSGKLGGWSISEILTYINNNSLGQINLDDIRTSLKNAKCFYICEVLVRQLEVQDKETVDKENVIFNTTNNKINPIVINDDYYVVDGRHRVRGIKSNKIISLIPSKLFYKLNINNKF